MGKLQDWSVTTCLFLFLFQALQIRCTSQTHVLSRLNRSKRGIGSSVDTNHLNAIRRLSVSSPQNTSGVNQQEQKERDLIENLPGQPSVSFRQYGGYVTVNESAGRSLYYYFVEATENKKSSPLVLWLNGGPGCSSLYGAFQELGPFRTHSDGKTLYTNPYSWNKLGNILFLESPAGTGFSYTNTTTDLENPGDMNTAADNYIFLVKWLERFPEYKGREFYIAGESYAGHYVPQLAQTILVHNENQTFINLRGILIGNPSLDDTAALMGANEFLVSHALLSQETFLSFEKNCAHNPPTGEVDCVVLSMKIQDDMEKINLYNILTPTCLNPTLNNQSKECTTVMQYDACGMQHIAAYFNQGEVQRSMHVTKVPYTWKLCNEALGFNWSQVDAYESMLPILKELMKYEQMRVWVYTGDTDTVIPITVTMYALKMMNLTAVTDWLPWFSDGQVGGFTEEYKGNFRYATVKGAGHEVPLYKPNVAFTLFKQFLLNSPLPLTP